MDFSRNANITLIDFVSGDDKAWHTLVSTYSGWLFSISLRILRNPDDAEDVLQEAFIKAYRGRHQLRDINRLGGWLRTICVRLCVKGFRKRQETSFDDIEAFLPASGNSPHGVVAARQELETVLKGMNHLSGRERACLTLLIFEDMHYREIAGSLGISHGAVRRYISNARSRLHALLDPDIEKEVEI